MLAGGDKVFFGSLARGTLLARGAAGRIALAAILLAAHSRSWRCKMPSIVGTWKLLHATARDAAGAARPSPYGGTALGRVTFTADGRMMSVVCDGRKELPAGVTREYNSYCGNYTYDGDKLVTRV